MIPAFIDRASLPHRPGVYLYKNKQGEVIYVGKAVDLYSRVASYFNQSHQDNKTAALVKSIGSCQTIEVSSEIEALILEANLIKKYKPLFNIKLTDDKDYLYIKITKQPFPQILTARRNDLADASDYFGPFPSAKTVKTTLKKLRRVFPWCSNPPNGKNTAHRACFYYHLGQCPGACVGLIEQNDYRRIIHRFAKFMDGNFQQLQEELQNQMNELAQHQQYEQASQVKKILEGLNYLTQSSSIEGYLEEPNYLQNQN
ncbi:GIY-YIG nuclease family protein, partial [Patescibacteria group bacterium]|nr:GIY-YIG nuclease family protein [Patescibacteria group bacterium]